MSPYVHVSFLVPPSHTPSRRGEASLEGIEASDLSGPCFVLCACKRAKVQLKREQMRD